MLIEAIPEDHIRVLADPDDRNRDGISGRLGESFDARLGRFGRKATFADLRSFIESAALGEMGLTSAGDTKEEKPGGRELPAGVDPTPEPELTAVQLDQLTRFVQLLAASEPDSIDPRDRRIFDRVGCADCHVAEFTTRSGQTALNERRVALYSDLLLHDLGSELATVCSPSAAPSEWRTTPLMGLRYRNQFMHDGRSQTLASAIEAHGGEAAAARERFRRLTAREQEQLLRFIRSL